MERSLAGKRVAVAGGRRFEELAVLIGKLGGEALARPMMASAPLGDPSVTEAVRKLCEEGCDWLVLVTGVGTRALVEVAEGLGGKDRILDVMRSAQLAARGYKTVKALRALGLKPVVQDDDGTVEGLKRQLEPFAFASRRVAVQEHGEPLPELTDWLRAQGASVLEIPLYRYVPPEPEAVRHFVLELLAGHVDAVAFTSNTQVRYLFEAAEALGYEAALRETLGQRVMAAAVGSMTRRALLERGVARVVAPEHERMGAMIMALAEHYGQAGERPA